MTTTRLKVKKGKRDFAKIIFVVSDTKMFVGDSDNFFLYEGYKNGREALKRMYHY